MIVGIRIPVTACWLGVGVLAVLVFMVITACGGRSDGGDSGARVEVTLLAHTLTGDPVRESDLDRSAEILEDRLDKAGIRATVKRGSGSRIVVVLFDQPSLAAADPVVELPTKEGLLEFYDLESNLVSPSITDNFFPVATESLYDLLAGLQSDAGEDETDNWYLFDADKSLVDGPVPTKRLLLPTGTLRDGWRILGTPPKTAVLECGIGEVVCPGVNTVEPKRNFFYLIRFDPDNPDPQKVAPEMTGAELKISGTRQDFDTTTGEPIVTMQFTDEGAAAFGRITREEADRGKALFNLSGGGGDPLSTFQHFALVVDRQIKSWPSIDWEQYPNGISGSNGAQITGIGDLQEAKDLAVVLQTGALRVRFEVESRREFGG